MGKTSILLVEDDPDDEALTLRALGEHNLANEIVLARDGVQALDLLHGTPDGGSGGQRPLPEVVLLDLKLPRLDGLEVLRRVRAHPRTKHLPVVILTSSAEDKDRLASYDLGANSYVRKPVDFSELRRPPQ